MYKIAASVVIPLIIVGSLTWWFWGETTKVLMIDNDKEFLSPIADNARVLYETRSIASYATVIIITSAVAFIPLLTLLWSTAKQSISNTLDLFVSLSERRRERYNPPFRFPSDLQRYALRWWLFGWIHYTVR